jgi:uncharacterized protein (TIGR03083 family)
MTVRNDGALDVSAISPLGHDEAQDLFISEVGRTMDLLRMLTPEEWDMQTDCPDWDVRRMYLHVLGAHESGASIRELMHQMWASWRHRRAHGGPPHAALSHVQVAEREQFTPGELTSRFEKAGLDAARSRRRMPATMRAIRINADPDYEKWSLGYLNDTIYLRDLWMHRIDATRATGRPMTITSEHDGRIVADIVAEWTRRHGQAATLELTGPAGGGYVSRGGAEPLSLDAIEYCRILAGRRRAEGLLTTSVPF